MKKLLLILCIAMSGCNRSNTEMKDTGLYVGDFTVPLKIVTIDKCEYYFGDWSRSTILTHKGNCNNHGK